MATSIQSLTRPAANVDHRAETRHRAVGLALGLIGVLLVTIAFIGNLVAANTTDESSVAQILAWTFGLTTLGFGFVKFGIAVILIGILCRRCERPAGRRCRRDGRSRPSTALRKPRAPSPSPSSSTGWPARCGRRCWPWEPWPY